MATSVIMVVLSVEVVISKSMFTLDEKYADEGINPSSAADLLIANGGG